MRSCKAGKRFWLEGIFAVFVHKKVDFCAHFFYISIFVQLIQIILFCLEKSCEISIEKNRIFIISRLRAKVCFSAQYKAWKKPGKQAVFAY